jgi:ribosomal protein L11 methyltransferase
VLDSFPDARIEKVEAGWEHRWRAFHRGVRIGALWVGPPWEMPPAGALPVAIEPGRAFGTGSHPTTRLCVELLADLPRGELLDVGCGSGVIAIAAVRLGFAPVVAVDAAVEAVEATRANAAANGVRVQSRQLDALTGELPSADVVVANIAVDVVEALAPRVDAPLLVTSGYLRRDEPSLLGYRLRLRRERDMWAGSLHDRSPDGAK